MTEPLVSVLILTYNHEKYIAQAIKSVVNQNTNFNYEVLIGEDCSTDRTLEIIMPYLIQNPEKLKLLNSESNVGALKNEANLMSAAKGKYIAFLEGDDFWTDNNKLQKQVDFLESNPDFGLVHADVNHYYEFTGRTDYAINKNSGIKVPEGSIFSHLISQEPFFIKTATSCFRKELVLKHFDYNLAITENWPLTDLPLWMDITFHSKAHYIDEIFATYRLLNESASRTKSLEKHLHYVQRLYKMKLVYFNKYKVDEPIQKQVSEKYYKTLLGFSYRMKDKALKEESLKFIKSNNLKLSIKNRFQILLSNF
jgi:glycosyltransferase involved in cell wall biosynthesis